MAMYLMHKYSWRSRQARFHWFAGLALMWPLLGSAADQAPVYLVRSVGLSSAQAAKLREAFGLKTILRQSDGMVRYADQAAFGRLPGLRLTDVQFDKDEGGMETVAEGFDFEKIKAMPVLSNKEALARAERSLKAAGLRPANVRTSVANTQFNAVGVKGESIIARKPIDTVVSYRFALNEIPLEGPGAGLRIAYLGDGSVSQLSYARLTASAGESVPVLDNLGAVERCAAALGGNAKIGKATLAYYAPPLETKPVTLEPMFRCEGANAFGGALQAFYVPAKVRAEARAVNIGLPIPTRAAAENLSVTPQLTTRIDVGSEGTGPCSGLPWTATNVASFNNRMISAGYPVQFSWVDANAWESDWKDPQFDGNDSGWVDDVDMAYWQGHGEPFGFHFSNCSNHHDTVLSNTDAKWGNRDAEWMALFTCLILKHTEGGQAWWQRWSPAFDGLHMILSFDTVSYHSASHGGTFANYMVRSPFLWWNQPMTVLQAWIQTSIDDQPEVVRWAVMGPIGSGGATNQGDYFWGKGSVGPDIRGGQITGYWWMAGPS